MYKYNDFIKINEEIDVMGSLKNLFLSFLKNVPDDIKKPISELTNKLGKTKDTEQMKKLEIDYLKGHEITLKKSLSECKDTNDVIKTTKDNLTAIYASVDAFVKNFNDDTKFSFETIFNKSNNQNIKKLFVKDEKQFNKMVEPFVLELVVVQSKPFGFKKEDILKQWKEKDKNPTTNPTEPTETNTTQVQTATKDANDALNSTEVKKESIDYLLILEADKQTGTTSGATEVNVNIAKLNTTVFEWFGLTLYKQLRTELTKKEDEKQGVSIDDSIKRMTSTENKDSVKKMMEEITKITDKKLLIELRDWLKSKGMDLDKNNTPL